jgi:IQ calmodulin-binding motif
MHQAKHAESGLVVRRSTRAGPTQVPGHVGNHQNPKGGFPCARAVLRLCAALLVLADAQAKPHVAAVERPRGHQVRLLLFSHLFFADRKFFTDRSIIGPLNVPTTEWQVGKTKLFLRRCVHEPLEEKRTQIVQLQAVIIQRSWKRYAAMKEFLRVREAAMKIQHGYRGWKQRILFLRQRRAAIVIQSHLRGVFAREVRIYSFGFEFKAR